MATIASRALITGITGQDGLYLGELLAGKGYEVFGLVRGQSNPKIAEVEAVIPTAQLLAGDLTDLASLLGALEIAQPTEVYNLGAMSFVGLSWKQAEVTADVTGMGVLRMLEALRIHTQGRMDQVRFYQASSSEMFGLAPAPQNERTPLHPRSPYAVAKAFGHHMTINYRESYGAFACSGVLYNHESPRRGIEFVTRKVTRGVARIALGLQQHVSLGTLDVERDWGFAGDYVEAMWRMLQQSEPDDYVIATGCGHSIRELLDAAFGRVGIADWRGHVLIDERYRRPAEVPRLVGDASKARELLGWAPRMSFEQLIVDMVDADLAREQAGTAARAGRDAVPPPRSAANAHHVRWPG